MKIYVGHLSERERFEHDVARDPGALGLPQDEPEDERSDGQIAEDNELDYLAQDEF